MGTGRILMISTHGYVAAQPELGLPDTGGQVVYLLEMSKALAKRGFEVDILTRQFEDQPESEEVADKIRLIRIPYGGTEFLPKEILVRYVPELILASQASLNPLYSDYELISSHYWDAGVAGMRLAKLWKVPHIHTPHSMGLLKRQNRAWGPSGDSVADHLDERIHYERMIYHQSEMVISTAAEQTRCLSESDEYNVPREKISQIPPGFDETIFHPPLEGERDLLRRSLGWSVPTVFSAGRLAVSKGYDLLIRAFPAVLKRVFNAQLVLAIGGSHTSEQETQFLKDLKHLAHQLGIGHRVIFKPCVDQRRLAEYYRAADVFVLSSRNEPFGMTALEAMASGTPTVVTTRGGLWEELVWGHDCVYCDPMDSDALTQSICSTLIHSRVRDQLSKHGATTAMSRYTWNEVANQFLGACRERLRTLKTAKPIFPSAGQTHVYQG